MISTLLTLCLASAPAISPVSIRVEGEGYLRFVREGSLVYAKEAILTVKGGKLASVEGPVLAPSVTIPDGTTGFSVSMDGSISITGGGQSREIARLVLAVVDESVRPVESRGFFLLEGKVTLSEPGEGLVGIIRPAKKSDRDVSVSREPEEQSVVRIYPPESLEKPKTSPENSQGKPNDQVNQIVEKTQNSLSLTDVRPDLALLQKGGVQIHLPSTIDIEGDTILMGQISQVFVQAEKAPATAALDLGTTPPFGVDRLIDRALITARLRRAGFPPDQIVITGAASVRVRRAGQLITHDQFAQAALAKVGGTHQLVEQVSQPPLNAPKGQVEFLVERTAPNGALLHVTVSAHVDGRRINSRTIILKDSQPTLQVKVGDTVDLRVKSGSVTVMTKGRVTKVDPQARTVTVRTSFGTELTGKPTTDGTIEVQA
ncbi:MAG: hypothetical protein MUC92_01135 [Fimbriimonadaceae bacterium]|jgi:hypothetical protein|nr:hypothetical protein [Fimbriimonadaceae bacterium]